MWSGSSGGIPVHDDDMPTAEIAADMSKRLARDALDTVAINGAARPSLGDRKTEPSSVDRVSPRVTPHEHGPVSIRKATIIGKDSIVGACARQSC